MPEGGEVTATDKPEFEVGFTVMEPFLLSLGPGFMKVMLWMLLEIVNVRVTESAAE